MARLINPSEGISGTNFLGQVQLVASLYQEPIKPSVDELKDKFEKKLKKSKLSKINILEYKTYDAVWGSITEPIKSKLYDSMVDNGIWLATKAPRDPEFYYDYKKVKEFNVGEKARLKDSRDRQIELFRRRIAQNREEIEYINGRISYARQVIEARRKGNATLISGTNLDNRRYETFRDYDNPLDEFYREIERLNLKRKELLTINSRFRDYILELQGKKKRENITTFPGEKTRRRTYFTWKTAWAMVKEIVKPPRRIMPAIVNNFYNYKKNPQLVDFRAYGELSANLGEPTKEWKRRYDRLLTMEFPTLRRTPNTNKVGGAEVGPGVAGKNFDSGKFKGYQAYIYFGHDKNSKIYADSVEARTKFVSKRASYVLRDVRNSVVRLAKNELRGPLMSSVAKVGSNDYLKRYALSRLWKNG